MFRSVLIALLLAGSSYCYPNESRVVNGTDAVPGQYPFMVSLRVASGLHLCGASIVSTKWILTAAHCVNERTPSSISIQYAVTTIAVAGPNIATVKRIVVHEKFAPEEGTSNDIALLELEGRLSINGKTIGILNLPQHGFEVPGGESGILIGWGYEQTDGVVQTNLQQVQLKIYSDEECIARHEGMTTVDHLCGGVDEGGKGQCSGDSGGPLIHNDVQVGIVSWSIKPCTVAPYPGVYTKVSHYVNWIRNIID